MVRLRRLHAKRVEQAEQVVVYVVEEVYWEDYQEVVEPLVVALVQEATLVVLVVEVAVD